jgi:hypothetical protein
MPMKPLIVTLTFHWEYVTDNGCTRACRSTIILNPEERVQRNQEMSISMLKLTVKTFHDLRSNKTDRDLMDTVYINFNKTTTFLLKIFKNNPV